MFQTILNARNTQWACKYLQSTIQWENKHVWKIIFEDVVPSTPIDIFSSDCGAVYFILCLIGHKIECTIQIYK